MCKRRGCNSDNFRPAQEPLHERWVWCLDCQDFSEMDKYEDEDFFPKDAKAPSRKTKKQGDKDDEAEKEAEERRKKADAKAANRKPKKKKEEKEPEKFECKERGCTFDTESKRGLSLHVTKTHYQKCDIEDCDFDTTSDQGMSTHRTRMHPDAPPCPEHPWYTAQRKPRSGCDTCMKAYEKNQ